MRSTFDFTPYRRSTVGFDRLFDAFETAARTGAGDNYPPYDIERAGDDAYRITLAVAGFKPGEIELTAQQNLLVVTGKRADGDEGRNFVHRGIATRAFERKFELADYVQVKGATLNDGLLAIELVREVPEAMRPRKVAIGGAQPTLDLEAANETAEDKKAA
ncbi:MAG: Hsp20 family protein [Sphingomonadaceae bacterium]|nr:Hsp20 family protein [Sphingomonadaceae bacterium]